MKELLADETFSRQLIAAESEEEVQKMLADKGVSLSLDEIKAIGDLLDKHAGNDDGTLSEDDLEQVAGGADFSSLGVPALVFGTFGLALAGYKAIKKGW